jgi:acyl-CoA thioesterase FadM
MRTIASPGNPVEITTVYRIRVLHRDCGPDDTVPLHHFTRWMDAASHHHFAACGHPPQARVTEAQITLLEHATPHDLLQFHTRVLQWRHDEVALTHRVLRDDVLICEAHETRKVCPLRERGQACTGAGRVAPRIH